MDKRNIEAIYPLSPLQAAFLFHGVDRENIDPGQLQLRIDFEGELDRSAFEAAWQWLVQLHPVLRTAIYWQDLEKPLQVVHKQCSFDVQFETFPDVDVFFRQDRSNALELGRAPIQRVTVISTTRTCHTMCWSCHHILLDGWSASIIIQQLMARYNSIIEQSDYQPEAVVPYQKWLQHIAGLDEKASRDFWLDELKGADADNRLWVVPAGSSNFSSQTLTLGRELSQRVKQQMRTLKTTSGQLMQLVWAIVLAQLKKTDEVLFGITVSGRTANLPGIESMVGLFVNSLPFRVCLAEEQSVIDLLQTLMDTVSRRTAHDHVSLTELHRWHCISGQHPFDSLLVIENFPWAEERNIDDETHDAVLHMTSFKGDIAAYYPLTLVVLPGERLQLNLYYMDRLIDPSSADELLSMIQNLLSHIIDDPEISIGQLRRLCTTSIPLREKEPKRLDPNFQPRHLFGNLLRRKEQPANIATNEALLQAWRSTLGIQDIGIHDNFFELGGNSFLGLVLLDHINQLVGKQLPLVTIFQAPTIDGMAKLLAQGFGRLPGTRLIPIRRKGSRTPFFMIHGGNFMASVLASHLDAQQPFYILDSHWDYGDIALDETVTHLASAYIKDMKSIQPQGPWLIGGYSMGAVFVYEMAQQLHAQGERVELLFLLDPPTSPDVFDCIDGLPESGSDDLVVETEPGDSTPVYDSGSTFRAWRTIKIMIKSRFIKPFKVSVANGYFRCGKLVPFSLRGNYVMQAYKLACKRYKLQSYESKIIIFSGEDYPDQNIWDYLATEKNTLVKFDGTHLDFTQNPELIHQWAAEFVRYIGATKC
jgi:pimeloyl-ACP methyl ester carboxylesterase